MEIYKVGGSVRDHLLNRPSKDIDFVVVGSTPAEMEELGYKQVGADFPVFLDRGGREFALARIERKTEAGYHGFEVDFDSTVTLEQDLSRRDLTINAMAQRVIKFKHHNIRTFKYDDEIIDPFNGQQDLEDGVLRYVSEAFCEDPVRALRIARFAARYDFSIDDSTIELIREMDRRGEFDALVKERVWNEFQRAIMEPHPHNFFITLHCCGILTKILKINADDLRLGRLLHCACLNSPLAVRIALIGFSSEIVQEIGGSSDVVKFTGMIRNYEETSGNLMKVVLRAHNTIELFKRFSVFHDDSWLGDQLIELLRFKAVVDDQPIIHTMISDNVIKTLKNIKLPEDIDIPPRERGIYLRDQRLKELKRILRIA